MPTLAEPRQSLLQLLEGLQKALQARFDERGRATRHRRALVQRRALLGLELLCKLGEQVLLPALHDIGETNAVVYDAALREIELLRDLSLLAAHTVAANRALVMDMLESTAQRHFRHLDDLLRQADDDALPWPALERETRALLRRWHGEVQLHGDIEDEERDPVGLPPR